MDNTKIINLTLEFKARIRHEIEKDHSHTNDTKYWLRHSLIMAEIAEMSFKIGFIIDSSEKQYFDKQADVCQYFCNWGMDWVAVDYFEIANYAAAFYWSGTRPDFCKDYIPFETFHFQEKGSETTLLD